MRFKFTFNQKPRTKRFLASAVAILAISGSMNAQLSGTYAIPTDFPTLASAVTALNSQGLSGPVVINIPAGFTETAPVGGYALTATGTAANTIRFQKNGAGANPLLTAFTGTATPGTAFQDGVFRLVGSDYVTIDGVDINDPNAANPATMEYGYALYKASATNGCQNNKIQNCVITLNRINNASGSAPMVDGSVGILTLNAVDVTATTALTASTTAGANSNNKFYTNTIQNCNIGIALIGYADVTPFTASDISNDISGNMILNYGGGGTSNPAAGVRTLAQRNLLVSGNVVNSNNGSGVNHATTLRGIYVNTATSANTSITGNTVTVNSSATTSQLTAIENVSGATAASNTVEISGNLITNCTYTSATSGNFYGIFNSASCATLGMSGNNFVNNTTAATSGFNYQMYNSGSVGTAINILGNTINGIHFTAASTSATVYNIYVSAGAAAAVSSIAGNNFLNMDFAGATGGTGAYAAIYYSATVATSSVTGNTFNNLSLKTSGTIYLINHDNATPNINVLGNSIATGFARTVAGTTYFYYNNGGPASGTQNVSFNTISNVSQNVGSSAFYGIYDNTNANQNQTFTSNTISNIVNGTGNLYAISMNQGNVSNCYQNTITNLTGGGNVYGITSGSGTMVNGSVYQNDIHTLLATGTSPAYGEYVAGGTSLNSYKNKIYDISNSNIGGSASGIYVSAGTTANLSNNTIGDIKAPIVNGGNAVTGIYAGSGGTINAYYNSVYLSAVSTGSLFGSSAAYATTGSTVLFRNNIFVNNSTPVGTGVAAAYRRSGAALTNYSASSNNNLFYAGTPGANNAIFYDGTTVQQTLANYKTFVGAREAQSVTENPSFASTTGSAPTFLHFNAATNTLAESGGVNIATYTDDYDGIIRQGNAGYAGTGTSPDIGADEFEGVSPALAINSITLAPAATQCSATARTISAVVTPGAAPITSVTVNYSYNGAAQTPLTLTGGNVSATSTWTAVIPAATPVNASVTWTVYATDGSFTKNAIGTSYQDAPLAGLAATTTASANPVCAGSTSTLSAQVPAILPIGAGALTTSGSGGSGGNNVSPYTHYYGGNRFQYMIRATELTAAGFSAGNLTSLAFDVSAAGTTYSNFAVSLTQTGTNNLSGGYITAGLAQVYSGNVTPVVGINTYNFGTPYNWDGVSNLVIQICWSNVNTGGTAAEVKYDNTSFVADFFSRDDSQSASTICGAVANSGSVSSRPRILLGGNRGAGFSYSWSSASGVAGTTNPLAVTPTVTTTYTATVTDIASGCTIVSSPVTVTATTLPAAPTATNSSQCGVGIPTAAVGGGTSYNWYNAAVAGTLIQTGTSSTYTNSISSSQTFYVAALNGVCPGPRTAVSVTVSIPDAVTAVSNPTTICPGGNATLTAVQSGTNNVYAFTWTVSPSAGAGLPGTPTGTVIVVNPTVAGSYVYSVTASDGICTTVSTVTVALNNPPVIGNASATPTALCAGGTSTLNAVTNIVSTGTTAVGTGTALTALTDELTAFCNRRVNYRMQAVYTAAELNAAGLTAGNITSIGYRINSLGDGASNANYTVKMGTTAVNALTNYVSSASFTTVRPAAGYTHAVGLNTITFSTPFNWDGVSNLVVEVSHDGADAINNAETYYTTTAGTMIVFGYNGATTGTPSNSRLNIVFGGQILAQNAGALTWQWNPGAINSNTAAVTPVNTGTTAITVVYTVTATDPAIGCSNTRTVSVLVNPLPAPVTAFNSSQCGIGVPTASVSGASPYRWYNAAVAGTLVQSGTSATYTNSISSSTTFYVSSFNGTCESPRTAITASVTIPDVVTATSTPTTLCPGSSATLTAVKTGTMNNAYSYTWTAAPAAGSGMPSSVTGASVVITPTTVGTYVYNVAASDGVCNTTSSVSVSLNGTPPIIASVTPTAVCSGASGTLSAVSGASGTVAIGTGTTTTGLIDQPTAFCNRWPSYRMQTVYTAAELQAQGLLAGNITSMAFRIISLGDGATNANFTVKCGTMTASSFTDFVPSTGFATVFPSATYTHSVGLNVITFGTPYYWNGVSNLVVEVSHDGADAANNSETYYTATVPNMVAWSRSGNTTGTPSQNRLNVVFGGSVIASGSFAWQWNPGAINTSTTVVNPVNTGTTAATNVYTVTLTNTATGCTNTATVGLLVNPNPVAVVPHNSIQCGVGVPTASVTGAGGTYNWYNAASSGTLMQTGTSPTYTSSISSTTTFYVSEKNAAGCEGPRTAITASATIPDAVNAVASPTAICPNGSSTLTAVKTGTNNVYSYTWTATAGGGLPATPTGSMVVASPSVAGTYVYTVTASDGVCTTVSSVSVQLNSPPSINATATPTAVCSTGSVTLNASTNIVSTGTLAIGTGTNLTGITSQPTAFCNRWPSYRMQTVYTAAELAAAGMSSGNITAITYNISSLGDGATNANFTVKCGTISASAFTDFVPSAGFATVFPPAIYTHAVGLNTITFATPFNWDGTSNLVIEISHDGADAINNAETYYSTTAANTVAWSISGGTTGTPSNQRLNIIFNAQTVVQSPGSIAWQWNPGAVNSATTIVNPVNTGSTAITVVYTVTATDPATTCSNTKTVSVVVNPVPAAVTTTNSTQCGVGVPMASVTGTPAVYNWYNAASGGSLLQTGSSPTYTSSISSTQTFYVAALLGNCPGPRTAITASVTTPDAVSASVSSATICPNVAVTLNSVRTGTSNPGYTYTWTASAPASGIPTSVTGASVSVTPTQGGSYTYSLTASDGTCTAVATTSILVNTPPSLLTSAVPAAVCSGGTVTLAAAANPATVTVGINSLADYTGGPYRQGAGADNKAQWLLTATELAAAGITPGNITALSFSATASSADVMNNFTIRLGATTTGQLTGTYDPAPATVVYGPSPVSTALGVNTYNFTTPFYWNGTDNIIVQVCHDIVPGGGGSVAVAREAITDRTLFTAAAGACTSTSGTTVAYRPLMIFRTSVVSGINWQWNPGAINSNTAIVTPSNPGTSPVVVTYTITGTDIATTCSNTAVQSVTVNPIPVVNATASNTVICAGTSATLTATGGTTYSWTPNNATTAITVVTPTTSTTYTVRGTSLGCSATNTVALTVNPTPTVTAATSNSVFCAGGSATLTTSGATTYTWNPGALTGASVTVTPTVTTTYTVSGATTGCVGTKTVAITVNQVPTMTISPASPTICAGVSTTLTATGATTYSWSNGANTNTTVVTPGSNVTYTVQGTNTCGSSTKTVAVSVNPLPTASGVSSSTLLCAGETATLTASGTATSFTWMPGSLSGISVVVSPTISTTYTLSGSGACGTVTTTVTQNVSPCTGIEELSAGSINVYPNPTTGYIMVDMHSKPDNAVLEVYDAIGKLVIHEELNKLSTFVNTTRLAQGIYVYKIYSNTVMVKIGRLVKE